MGEGKKKAKTKSTKTSSVKKKKITPSELSSEELLEQILNKKKKVNTLEQKVEKVDVSKLSNDELLDFIMAKKKKKKATTTKKKVVEPVTVVEETAEVTKEEVVEKVVEETPSQETYEFEEEHEKKKIHLSTTVRRIIISTLCLLFVCIISFVIDKSNNSEDSFALLEELNITDSKKIEEEKNEKFNACLVKDYDVAEENESIITKKKEITDYLAKHNVSIGYEDLTYGYKYLYKEGTVYYAASTIKSLDALYIYTKAAAGEINLEDTLVYNSSNRLGSSEATSKFRFGTRISLRDLVKYAVTVSDNSAHKMLVNYIGKSNLKNFGNSLGATYTLSDYDLFGNITVNDGMVYMKNVYKFTQENEELGSELASYFINSDDNNLKFEDLGIQALTKYGYYDYYYHNIGVVDSYHPYVLVILTKEGQRTGKQTMLEVSKMIMELHDLYYSNRQSACLLEIYGE